MILADCSIGPLFFLHVNVSGGEPCEVQDNVRREPVTTVTVGCDGGCMSGAAVETMNNSKQQGNGDTYKIIYFFC